MKKRITLIPVMIILGVIFSWKPTTRIKAVVVPVDRGQEFMESLKFSKKVKAELPAKTIITINEKGSVLIEGHKKTRSKKVFSAAQFVCGLPIEGSTFKTVCKEPKEAEAAIKKMKEQGFNEIWLTAPAFGEVYDAIVKSARELEMRINA